jgi:hypothetical protein
MSYEDFVASLDSETIASIEYEEMSLREYFELQMAIMERMFND